MTINVSLLGGRIAHLEVAPCPIFLIPPNRVRSKQEKHKQIVWLIIGLLMWGIISSMKIVHTQPISNIILFRVLVLYKQKEATVLFEQLLDARDDIKNVDPPGVNLDPSTVGSLCCGDSVFTSSVF